MSEPRASLIIVTCNSRGSIRNTLAVARRCHDEGLLECIVVDNASGDGTADVVAAEHPWSRLVRSPVNLGYGRGLNLGLRHARAPYVLLSNADACLPPEGLRALVSFMDAHPGAGMAAPALLGPGGERHPAGGLPTPWGEVARAAGFRGWTRRRREIVPGGAAFSTDWLCGAMILARRDLIERLGGFDPRFFLYFEETDLCRRVRETGMSLWAVGEATGAHESAASAKATGARMHGRCISEHFYRSRLHYFAKHHGWAAAVGAELGELAVLSALAPLRALRNRHRGLLARRLRSPILRLPRRPGDSGPPIAGSGACPAPQARRAGEGAAGALRRLGIVVIGRNEGARLRRCLVSVAGCGARVVYVDSGSRDGSVETAWRAGAVAVALDDSRPFTAARARNAGFERLLRLEPGVEFVQFVDGDCEIAGGWLEQALPVIAGRPDVAVVCGRLRERAPSSSIYNRLCELEWRRRPGEIASCGGVALVRAAAFRRVSGFRESLVAGEEGELCTRLRRDGWRIWHLDAEMGRHDAAMDSFRRWWRRARRAGHAYAETAALDGPGRQPRHRRAVGSALAWGLVAPAALLALPAAAAWNPWFLAEGGVILAAYVMLALRIARRRRCLGDSPREAALYVAFCILSKTAQSLGAVDFWAGRLRARRRAPAGYGRSAAEASAS